MSPIDNQAFARVYMNDERNGEFTISPLLSLWLLLPLSSLKVEGFSRLTVAATLLTCHTQCKLEQICRRRQTLRL